MGWGYLLSNVLCLTFRLEMDRRTFNEQLVKGIGGTTLFSSLASSAERGASVSSPARPNIVFVFSDQHSYKYTGYAGHPYVQTPHLDRIARQGVVFTQAYCGSPVCVPGRASAMTGMYPSDCNSFCNSTVWDGSHPTWGTRLSNAGYHCWATGKMDLNDDYDIGFEEVRTHHGHRHNPDITSFFRRPLCYRVNERPDVDGKVRNDRDTDYSRAKAAERFIKGSAVELDAPWAMYVGMTEPHPPFRALRKYFDLYYPNRVDMPNLPPGHLDDMPLVFQEIRHFKRIATPIADERIRRARATYYGMITELDEYIGQLWRALEETDQLDQTIFIYSSDHGESLGEHGLWYKNNLYDVATRVPLVVTGPGIPQGQTVDTPVAHVDLVQTILEWGEVAKSEALRGHSLMPLMHDEEGTHPGFAYSESHSEGNCTGSFMIRKGDWKYIYFTWYDDALFNVAEDPGEFTNRIDDPSTKDIQEELKTILHDQVDPEAVTRRAFQTQGRMLEEMSDRMTEQQLYETFESRLGPGQARALAQKHARASG